MRPKARHDRGGLLLLAKLDAKLSLMPDQVECDYDFSLEASRGNTRELTLACAPGLELLGVTYRNNDLEDWDLLPAAAPGGGRTCACRLPETLQGGPVPFRVRGMTASPVDQTWPRRK